MITSEKHTAPSLAPEDYTAGSNEASRTKPTLTTKEIDGWMGAIDKRIGVTTDEAEIDTISHTKEELAELRQRALRLDEGFHAGIAGIPLRALKGQTKPGDRDHVPSLELTDQQ